MIGGTAVVPAFATFDWYRRRVPFYSGLINTFSKGTLAIYVFHESYYIYPYLWERVFPVGAWFQTLWFIVLYAGAILALFCGTVGFGSAAGPTVQYAWKRNMPGMRKLVWRTAQLGEEENGRASHVLWNFRPFWNVVFCESLR